MPEKKQKFETVNSPEGIVLWASVDRPSTKFKEDGEFSVKISMNPKTPGVKDFVTKIKKMSEAAHAEQIGKEPKYKKFTVACPVKEEEGDDGEPTGNFIINAKMAATYTPKDKTGKPNGPTQHRTVAVFDCAKKPLVGCRLGKGSKVRLSMFFTPYAMPSTKEAGLSCKLKAVQVINLVEYSGVGNADSYGFSEEEGGYVAPEPGEGGEEQTETAAGGKKTADF